ncbi:MAG TPA: hypothetical protein VMV62_02185 [Candidatus Paceibacterota bacterium]|nr:hypothetical protein [Candidatus Paceibacterota bacterium]
MRYAPFLFLALCFLPTSASAARAVAPATFSAAQSLVAASSSPGNAYAAGASVVLTASVVGDFSALGGSVITAAPVEGDDLILAGSVGSRAPVAGDFRAAGGSIDVGQPVAGDLFALGFSVRDAGRVGGSVFIVAANTTLTNGSAGPVTVYGNNVSLAGDFAGNVKIIAGGRVSIAPGTAIRGTLSYEAPVEAVIPSSAVIGGGVTYTNTSYLPDTNTSRTLALASLGFFLIARILGALILAGLLAGLFSTFARTVIDHAATDRPRDILLALLLGFAIIVATPIVIALLMLTFVGIGIALLILILYALLVLLALMYAGILVGGLLVRRFFARDRVLWHDGVLGMAVLSLVSLVPFIGLPIVFLFMLFSAGTLLQLFFHFAFPHEEETPEML